MFRKLFGRGKKKKEKKKKEEQDLKEVEEKKESAKQEEVKAKKEEATSGGLFSQFEAHNPDEAEEEAEVEGEEEEEEEEGGFFSRLKNGLDKTRDVFASQVNNLFTGRSKIDDELYEELEEILIQADVGVHTTMKMVDELRQKADERKIKDPAELQEVFKEQLQDILSGGLDDVYDEHQLTILMVVGVNGVGKTTTIGKIAQRAKMNDQEVLLAAGDTFRAAAIEQLETWGGRVGVDIISHQEGADAAAVAYDAVQAAKSRGIDLLIVDTAGRLHTQDNLMQELRKVRKIIGREADGARVEVLLVLDATTGQNAITQAKTFNKAVKVDGIALTKLDGTAKGGVILAIKEELDIPIKLIGVGEAVEDLQDFEAEAFIEALFDDE
ncbi:MULTISPECIES: signal recognition particle-docking protein FtsY [unclassified Candidatus Frackibacter]|uniref:signal recognition particle-docking protein FtsY n=1 Tax=unclassified Candidatus Frackibacter TaxID=2648818 RepID=UPI00088474D0|nr:MULTISPECIES: signal recognition particle-docking protein FtsY [unclassified Candidatus Frackibacter]SDC01008.1 fused signal recognition particle receptor [Candidatus Frackibacter sp. WG11]SEM32335.1 fused signal recognition particle receptor [Candidatus Frackibacter sp. WG12]SFL37265.1 fused signal recognition particle receptor [Candidatus Frackibacter sp. WG13]